MSFDDAFASLMEVEKGYWDDPAGGPTMYGVTERVARAWGHKGDMRQMPLVTARSIAKSEYWDRFQRDQFAPAIGYQVFDAAYNGGMPVRWLQKAAGANVDGIIGAKTIAAVRAADPAKVVLSFSALRLQYLTSLSGWASNGKGPAHRRQSFERNRMIPLIPIAMQLAQFAPGIIKLLSGSDKAEDVASKVIDVAN